MPGRTVTVFAIGVATATLAVWALPRGAQTPTRPNILLILADDLGAESSELYPDLYNASAASGRGQVATPNIRALAARGIVFDNAWATPMGSPTRASILTGLYGHNTGVTRVNDTLPGSTTSIFELLTASPSALRFNMAVFGKWHLAGGVGSVDHVVKETGVPVFKGFVGPYTEDYYNWTVDSSSAASAKTTVYATTAITDFAIDFIRTQNKSQPWFVYLPYNAPHGTAANNGFQVPPANLFKINVDPRPAGDPKIYNGDITAYQAMVQALDTEIGRLFRAMDQAGQLDNTLIIFMGDNGTPVGVKDPAAKIRGSKQSVYEGGVRVPLVVAGAGVTRTGRDAHLISSPDLFATIAQLAGALPGGAIHDGYSFVPLFRNAQAATGRAHSFTELCANNGAGVKRFAIRDETFKLLYSGTDWEMFDLKTDPWETTNLYDSPQHTKVRAAWLAEVQRLKAKAATAGCFVNN